MDTGFEEKRRNVIPRWRDFKTTLALGELRSSGKLIPGENVAEGSIDEQLSDWQNNKSLSFATDLVGAAFVLGQRERIQDAIDFILSPNSEATDLQRRVARQARDANFSAELVDSQEITTKSSDELIHQSEERVRKFRAQLRTAPRNPIKLVELSREYAILGSREKAIRSMEIAVGLAPANRFVLRSAARLFVHALEFDRAHYILKRAPSLRSDPWLLAAEIAVSSVMDRTSSHVKIGMGQLSDANFSPFEVSELASAIATLEMNDANYKLARKLFRKALRKPTENSIAQAEWASRSVQNLSVAVENFDTPRKYEALASLHFKEGDFGDAVNEGKNWILDQPFAVSPILFTGFVSSVMEDFELSKKIYTFGLGANPGNATLLNNLAFALASNDEAELAEAELERIDRTTLTAQEQIITTATEGLIEFRRGNPTEGRALYRRAIQIAEESNEPGYAMRALVYLAREEINSRTELAKSTFENAENEFQKFTSKELDVLLKRLRDTIESDPAAFDLLPEAKRIAKAIARSRKASK